jgi:SAM-dependent methyltransferase
MASDHYNSTEVNYFAWQSNIGEFGGWANVTKFTPFIRPDFSVLDFGCGGGYLLEHLQCKQRRGIEVSSRAREETRRRNIDVVGSVEEIPDGWADIIISNSALEHCLHPLKELQALLPKLRVGGRAIFVVPCEPVYYRWKPGDINHHLYSWSPMALGNLFSEAGFDVEECKAYVHVWPPRLSRQLAKLGGRTIFDIACRAYGLLIYLGVIRKPGNRVRVVARRNR